MSIFYCTVHERPEDSDFVGYVETTHGPVCHDGATEAEYMGEPEPIEPPTEEVPHDQ